MPDITTVHVTLSGDVYLKSRRTQIRLIKRVLENLRHAIGAAGSEGATKRIGTHRYELAVPTSIVEAVRSAAGTVFGIASVDTVIDVEFSDINGRAKGISEISGDEVVGRTFAVRVKRRGTHAWNSMDLARLIGSELLERSGGVDLSNPDVEIRVTVLDDRALLVVDHRRGAGGLPIGTQDRVLCLVSGGFDSAVAAWMLMSRGCPVDFVHFSLNCAQSDHALAVARELWTRWGHGTEPTVHLVEFQPVKDALYEHVDARMRQVTLKVMMAKAASAIAKDAGISALVTGDALGQVSSQTLPHLVAVSRSVDTPLLRPLLGLPKQSIIDLARQVGTAELSARAQEVCDLSAGRPVATAASEFAIAGTVDRIPDEVLSDVVTTRKVFDLRDWVPGQL